MRGYESATVLECGLGSYIDLSNKERPHTALDPSPRLRCPRFTCPKLNTDGDATGVYKLTGTRRPKDKATSARHFARRRSFPFPGLILAATVALLAGISAQTEFIREAKVTAVDRS